MAYALSRGNAAIYYETLGTGTPIVFIHPPGMGYMTFQKQRSLAKDFQLIFYDMRGNGKSSSGHEQITMSLMAEDVKAVLDELNIEKAVIFGYSNGGSTAMEFALTYPERTLGLVTSGSFPEVNSFVLRNEFRLGILVTHMKGMTFLANVLAKAHFKRHETVFIQRLVSHIKRSNPHIVRDMYIEGLHYRCTERLHEIKVPMLLMYGGLSFYLHHYRYMFLERVRDLDIAFVENATHQLPTKNTREFNRLLTQFVKERIEN